MFDKRDEFIVFLKNNSVTRAADQYESGIRSLERELDVDVDKEFDADECDALLKKINEYVNSLSEDSVGNRRNWKYYVNKYVLYKKKVSQSVSVQPGDIEIEPKSYNYASARHHGINKVFYGTPGCGKSYYVEKVVLAQEQVDKNNVVRTTFFNDYSNTDFVGQVIPTVDATGTVFYSFNPGPFTKALKRAIDNPDEKIVLIIEELNRGNAPGIFGDIFQLLDRDENGTSYYEIDNVNIQSYLNRESVYDLDYIKIPANLYIFATMNTSDQNVLTLDTAFKRRWDFEKLTNDFVADDDIGNKYVPGMKKNTWKNFVVTINDFILSHSNCLSSEDKRLGKYFVDKKLLLNSSDADCDENKRRNFAYKVLEYLWDDVAKFNRNEWFDTNIKSLDSLIKHFVDGKKIFSDELVEEFKKNNVSETDSSAE